MFFLTRKSGVPGFTADFLELEREFPGAKHSLRTRKRGFGEHDAGRGLVLAVSCSKVSIFMLQTLFLCTKDSWGCKKRGFRGRKSRFYPENHVSCITENFLKVATRFPTLSTEYRQSDFQIGIFVAQLFQEIVGYDDGLHRFCGVGRNFRYLREYQAGVEDKFHRLAVRLQ